MGQTLTKLSVIYGVGTNIHTSILLLASDDGDVDRLRLFDTVHLSRTLTVTPQMSHNYIACDADGCFRVDLETISFISNALEYYCIESVELWFLGGSGNQWSMAQCST